MDVVKTEGIKKVLLLNGPDQVMPPRTRDVPVVDPSPLGIPSSSDRDQTIA